MELLNMLDAAAYSVQLSSFVSMSSPRHHRSHCRFLSAIFRHLVQNKLFNTRACGWCSVCVEAARTTIATRPWLLITDSRIHPFKQRDVTLSFTSPALGVDPDNLSPILGLCRSQREDWRSCTSTLLNDWMRPQLHGRYWNHIFSYLLSYLCWTFSPYFCHFFSFFYISSQGSTTGLEKNQTI